MNSKILVLLVLLFCSVCLGMWSRFPRRLPRGQPRGQPRVFNQRRDYRIDDYNNQNNQYNRRNSWGNGRRNSYGNRRRSIPLGGSNDRNRRRNSWGSGGGRGGGEDDYVPDFEIVTNRRRVNFDSLKRQNCEYLERNYGAILNQKTRECEERRQVDHECSDVKSALNDIYKMVCGDLTGMNKYFSELYDANGRVDEMRNYINE